MITLIIIHFVCAIIAHGYYFAYMQDHWPTLAKEEYQQDHIYSCIMSICFGSGALATVFIMGLNKYGWRSAIFK
jgi:hypothetical protein